MQKFLLPVQQNLDVMEKTDVKFGFSGQKNIENYHTHQLFILQFFSVTQCNHFNTFQVLVAADKVCLDHFQGLFASKWSEILAFIILPNYFNYLFNVVMIT